MSVGTFAFVTFIVCFAVCYNILHDYNVKKLQEEQKYEEDEFYYDYTEEEDDE